MTEKEKKAIYSFNKWIEISEKGHLDYFQIIDKDIEDMKTVLNLIQNLQEENKKYKRMLAEIHAQSLNNSIAEKKKYEEQLEALNEGWKIELEKKEKMIDLMANSFAEEGFYSENCQTLIDNDICPDDCNKCVKRYFERKVEEGK